MSEESTESTASPVEPMLGSPDKPVQEPLATGQKTSAPSADQWLRGIGMFLLIMVSVTTLLTGSECVAVEPLARLARLHNYQPSLIWATTRKVPVPTPTPTPTPVPTPTPTPIPTPIPTPTPTPTPAPCGNGTPCIERGDVEMSLFWDTKDDLDFYMKTPSGTVLNYKAPGAKINIHLDVDMTVGSITDNPIEHFVVPQRDMLEPGQYTLYVDYFKKSRSSSPNSLPFHIHIKDGTQEYNFTGNSFVGASVAPAVCVLVVDENKNMTLRAAGTTEPGLLLAPFK